MKKTIITAAVTLVVIAAAYWLYGNEASAPAEEPQAATSTSTKTSSDTAKVEQYVKANISALSPEKEVLGGRFFVTDIEFTGDKAGRVEYEDGHNAYAADFTYAIDAQGKVVIRTFRLANETAARSTSTTPTINFSKPGNLVKAAQGDGWEFVYEEPGKPALRVSLSYVEGTVCMSGGNAVSCEGSALGIGDRVRVEGDKQGSVVTVAKITKL